MNKPKTDKSSSEILAEQEIQRLEENEAEITRLKKQMKPKTDKQGWEEEFDNKVKEMPKKLIELVEWNKIKDFIRLQREEVRREVVEEITTKIRTKRKELWKFYHEAQLWEEQEQIIRPLDELINQLALSSDGEKKGKR